jgi:sigma54-dependent transcription regulator
MERRLQADAFLDADVLTRQRRINVDHREHSAFQLHAVSIRDFHRLVAELVVARARIERIAEIALQMARVRQCANGLRSDVDRETGMHQRLVRL